MSTISIEKSILYYTDINECLSQPCANGGTCRELIDEYNCMCSTGYTGINCETGNHGKLF